MIERSLDMPFTFKIDLGSEHSIVFEGWIESAFARYVPKGTAFAKASGPDAPGLIVTNGSVFISTPEPIELGVTISPGTVIAYGCAEGEDIPYGRPHCFFEKATTDH